MNEDEDALHDVDLDFKRHESIDDNINVLLSDPSVSPPNHNELMLSHEQESTDPISRGSVSQQPLLSQISSLSVESLRSAIEYVSPLTPQSKLTKFLRIQLFLLILTIGVLAAIFHRDTVHIVKAFLSWIGDHPVSGSFLFILWLSVTIPVGIPASISTIGCGYVFFYHFGLMGLPLAILIVWIGSSGGALISFLLSRYLFRSVVLRFANRNTKFQVIESMMETHGWQVACVIRLSPLVPFAMENYVFGVTRISFIDYLIALIAVLPGCAFYTFIGSTIHELSSDFDEAVKESPLSIVFLVLGLVITVIATVCITLFARRKFRQIQQGMEQRRESAVELTNEIGPDGRIQMNEISDLDPELTLDVR